MSEKEVLVLYHGGCTDGFCAAWIAHQHFGDKAEYVPVNYGNPPPETAGKEVYIVDFSYSRDVLKKMCDQAKMVHVFDHHKTAKEDLKDFKNPKAFVVFDMNQSGGRLTWDWFMPTAKSHWLVDYTEDRDLWRWKLPDSKAINAAIRSYAMIFEVWDMLSHSQHAQEQMVVEGKAILRAQEQQIDLICKHAREIEMDGHMILAVNSPLFQSEVAGKLAEGRPFAACWYCDSEGKVRWSLRSDEDGVDVSLIASMRGGGGHKHAAGFEQS